jgi:hypothetical protein
MSPHDITASVQRQKLTALQIVLLAAFLVVCGMGIVSSTAQSSKQDEREFKDTTPQHLPIKIKIKNAEKVKDLKNENWVRDLEIEVENKSNKPIYFLHILVILDDVITENSHPLGFPLTYGRSALADGAALPQSDDVPIKPGATYTFKIPEDLQLGWEGFATRHGLSKAVAKKIRIKFQVLSFGDGTGFVGTQGVPVDIHEPPLPSS